MSISIRRQRIALGIGFPTLAAAVATLAILASPGEAASARPADSAGPAKQTSVTRAASLPAAPRQMTSATKAGSLAAANAAKPTSVVVKQTLSGWLLDKAGGALASQAFSMVFSAIGLNNLFDTDPNTALLNEIKAQLSTISVQLVRAQATLDSLVVDVRRSDFDVKIIALRQKSNRLRELLAGPFTRVVDAVADLEKLREGASTPDKIEQAQKAVNDRRYEFLLAFDRCCESMPADIHAYLVPGPASSVLASLGRLRLGEKRYLTSSDSADIRAVYTMVAESEALASWMKMERFIPADPDTVPPGTFPGSIAEFNRARREFLSFRVAEARHVPPMIPAGVVVDAGQSPRNNTNNAAMWLPTSPNLRFQPGVGIAGTVPTALADVDRRYAQGFNDWRIPSQSAVTVLLGEFTGRDKTPNRFLSGLNPGSPAWRQIDADSWPFIWSSDLITQRVTCMTGNPDAPNVVTVDVPTHTGVSTSTSTPAWSGRPPLQRQIIGPNPSQLCANYVRDSFASASAAGGYIAERDTGVMPIDYTAIGAGPESPTGCESAQRRPPGFRPDRHRPDGRRPDRRHADRLAVLRRGRLCPRRELHRSGAVRRDVGWHPRKRHSPRAVDALQRLPRGARCAADGCEPCRRSRSRPAGSAGRSE